MVVPLPGTDSIEKLPPVSSTLSSRFPIPVAGYRDGTLLITGTSSISPLSWVINVAALETLLTG